MASAAHCAYCFETLVASFEHRNALSISQTEELWDEYSSDDKEQNSTNATSTSASASPRTSRTAEYPLFVTWNTISSRSGQKTLRGCIGTFKPKPLGSGLGEYSLTAAFEDDRFPPISQSELPRLQVCVTLLTNFSQPTRDPLAWEVGKHGIRISFTYNGGRYGATYLPDVAKEQGWTKEEALISLMRKAGWSGRKDEWRKVQGLELVTYEGKKVSMDFAEFKEWRKWAAGKGVKGIAPN